MENKGSQICILFLTGRLCGARRVKKGHLNVSLKTVIGMTTLPNENIIQLVERKSKQLKYLYYYQQI